MRPIKLELQGFASFRENTVIDFENADLFVLTGPTGSGKSSIIDAITFALYGFVARYDSKQVASPVISQGALEAKVRLDFSVGTANYTIARVVKLKGGHNVSFEHNGEVLSASVTDVKQLVPAHVGLEFEEFTRCVVLPQGDFAELLHASGADRRKLLVRLLDIGLYGRVQERAIARVALAKHEIGVSEALLAGQLANATPENLAACKERLARVAALCLRFEGEQPRLDDLSRDATAAAKEADDHTVRATALRRVKAPPGVAGLAKSLAEATDALTAAQHEFEQANAAAADARAALEVLPERAATEQVIAAHKELAALEAAVERAGAELERARLAHERAVAAHDDAERLLAEANERHAELLRGDAAFHASQGLEAGAPCPVCGEKLTKAPSLAPPEGLPSAEQAWKAAEAALRAATGAQLKAAREFASAESTLAGVEGQRAKVAQDLDGQPSLADAQDQLGQITLAIALAKDFDARVAQALQAQKNAAADLQKLTAAADGAWTAFGAARDPFAPDGAPPPQANDLALSWSALVEWAATAAQARESDAEAARTRAAALVAERDALVKDQASACEAAGVPLAAKLPRDAALVVSGQLEKEAETLAASVELREAAQVSLASAKQRHGVASQLAQHFKNSDAGFVNWFLGEAMRDLCAIASSRLRGLSADAYSLDVSEDGDFVVVDHANADARRPVKTLSGGETFLASLSLALALAEQVARVSPQGAAHLESLFLDEGFGTLDPETLDTVRGAVNELRAGGRMVGIVTHVRELAEQIPTQFRVSKSAGSSRVERVEL